MFAPRSADSETPTLLMVCTRIIARDPLLLTVTDADLSDGDTLRVMTLTIFPDLSITVNTTTVAPFAPAFGENRMRPVNELIPGVTVGVVSVAVEVGRLPLPIPSIDAGAADADAALVSIVIVNDALAGPVLSAASVTDADTVHVPSVKAGSEHLVAEPAV